jgi:thioredoxin 1
MAGMVAVTEDSWGTEIEQYKGAALVDFWATYCGPCKMLAPKLEELAGELGTVKFCKLDIEENDEIAQRFNIAHIPCLVLFKDGQEKDRLIGGQYSKTQLKEWIDKKLKA